MYEGFGAVVDESSVEFKLFFPDSAVDSTQYGRGGLPQLTSVRVVGDFQAELGGTAWDFKNAPVMSKQEHPHGWLYSYRIPQINDGFYQYKYFVEFENGTTRWCGDPCSKYGGETNENSAFVVGGNSITVKPIAQRLPLKDLIIYELMIDDFTAEFRGVQAPFDAVRAKLDYLQSLGINAIEFMPWTAWPGDEFSWGYDPVAFFSVEHRYYNDPTAPLDKLYRLQLLINELHERGIHVIMDGVFNHVRAGASPDRGFPYFWLYQNPLDSPFIGAFEDRAFFEDFDFHNECTVEFITDVCKYWLNDYCIDGIRFDYVKGFYRHSDPPEGISRIIRDLNVYTQEAGLTNIALTLELLTDNRYDAVGKTNEIQANGCWYDPLMWQAFDVGDSGHVYTPFIRAINAGKDFESERRPVTYLENHDHSTLTEHARGRNQWWRTQPLAIALFTASGAPMLHNGQEFGEQYWFPEDGDGRVMPRPLGWVQSTDDIGQNLRRLYRKLSDIRQAHPALRSANFYPEPYDSSQTAFNTAGYGVDETKDVVIYHRWGHNELGQLERFIIVLNFSAFDQVVNLPFSDNGHWEDLLNDNTVQVQNYWLYEQRLSSHWGRIYYKLG
ncbi:MAG: alpha-amylase family glycosyl hydrolase [Anaerolineae bacterium]